MCQGQELPLRWREDLQLGDEGVHVRVAALSAKCQLNLLAGGA